MHVDQLESIDSGLHSQVVIVIVEALTSSPIATQTASYQSFGSVF
jgi:hypothetical protein